MNDKWFGVTYIKIMWEVICQIDRRWGVVSENFINNPEEYSKEELKNQMLVLMILFALKMRQLRLRSNGENVQIY